MSSYEKMVSTDLVAQRQQFSIRLVASYILDWILLIALAVGSYVLGRVKPNFRHFSLADPNISFPYTVDETIPNWLLFVLCALAPAVVILVVILVLVPGGTVPRGTPALVVWKRKLWELQISWLGLLMAAGSAWFFVSGLKNMCGKPRPDALDRCRPDLQNADRYIVGGFRIPGANGHLYSAAICTETDERKLWDGFRSYPSGHAAASAGGLIYLSLFVASKFAVTFPFVMPGTDKDNADAHVAFPSRLARQNATYGEEEEGVKQGEEEETVVSDNNRNSRNWPLSAGQQPAGQRQQQQQHMQQQGLRTRAAAPPVFLLIITLVPFCLSIVISASRWFDYRHHGFDILFGFLIGTICALYSFRYYHMPIQDGAGWAWGPRDPKRAFWVGVGQLGYGGRSSGGGIRRRGVRAGNSPTAFSADNHNNYNNDGDNDLPRSPTYPFQSPPGDASRHNNNNGNGSYDGGLSGNGQHVPASESVQLQRLRQEQARR